VSLRVCILGAGAAGLTAAWALTRQENSNIDIKIIERESEVGGLARGVKVGDLNADFGPHRFQTRVPEVLDVMKQICGDSLRVERNKKIRIVYKGHFLEYPLDSKNVIQELGFSEVAGIGLDYLKAHLASIFNRSNDNYENWVLANRGKRMYRELFEPMAHKMWGVDAKTLSADVGRERVVLVGIMDLVKKLLGGGKRESAEYQDIFYYPTKGFHDFPDGLARSVCDNGGTIQLNSEPTALNFIKDDNRDKISLTIRDNISMESETETFDYVLSTIPINNLCNLCGDALSHDTVATANSLPFRGLRLLYLVLDQDRVSDDHMIYFPETRFPFHRIYEQKSFAPVDGKTGSTIICVEFPADEGDEMWDISDDELARVTLPHLEELNLVKGACVIDTHSARLPKAYPRYDKGYLEKVTNILQALGQYPRLFSFGRGGLFKLNNTDHAIEMGLRAAEQVLNGEGATRNWFAELEHFRAFTIVD